MRVRVTEPARADIREIFEHLKKAAGRRKAREVTSEVRERCAGLSRMPERYQLLERFEHAGIRRRVYRDYPIVYRVLKMDVEVLRVIHGASDIERVLSDLR
ncbi:MAG: type II toxin-antitoxin system RelE/ParE family toxin [Pseudomonadota bacterium]